MAIALNAEPIVAARLRGMKPAEMIRISLAGALVPGNHTVHAKPGIPLDWRWVRDLDVCVCANSTDDWHDTLKAIALERPEHLSLWFVDLKAGSKVYLVPAPEDIEQHQPPEKWTHELDMLPWLDFQNADFVSGQTYDRHPGGMPYAAD